MKASGANGLKKLSASRPVLPEAQPGERPGEHILWRADLPAELNVSTETVRRWIRAGKLPEPDVKLSLQSRGWKLSTLRAAGINLP